AVLGIVDFSVPGRRRARNEVGENRQAQDLPATQGGILVANVVQRLSFAVVRLLEPGGFWAEIGFFLPALEDLDLGLAFGIRLLPIAGGIGRGGVGRVDGSK